MVKLQIYNNKNQKMKMLSLFDLIYPDENRPFQPHKHLKSINDQMNVFIQTQYSYFRHTYIMAINDIKQVS